MFKSRPFPLRSSQEKMKHWTVYISQLKPVCYHFSLPRDLWGALKFVFGRRQSTATDFNLRTNVNHLQFPHTYICRNIHFGQGTVWRRCWCRHFPFRKRSMPFVTVDVISNNSRCHFQQQSMSFPTTVDVISNNSWCHFQQQLMSFPTTVDVISNNSRCHF